MAPASEDSPKPALDVMRLVQVLDRHGVEYLIVGGLAAAGYGAQRPTDDLDCVVRRGQANLERLAAAMRELDARLHVEGMTDEQARQLPVQLDARTLSALEISTWVTDAGGLDVLADIPAAGGGRLDYEQLLPRSNEIQAMAL